MKRPTGMALPAFQAFIRACYEAEINPARIMQTLGNAKASAGTHGRDGTLNGEDYSAAVDIRAKDLNVTEIRRLLTCMAKQGFAAWWRHEGSFAGDKQHIHAIYCGLPMKSLLKAQVRDFLNDRTGLVGHATEKFYTAPRSIDLVIQALYLHANPHEAKVIL